MHVGHNFYCAFEKLCLSHTFVYVMNYATYSKLSLWILVLSQLIEILNHNMKVKCREPAYTA